MFQMGIEQHVRLGYESLQDACEAHAEAAARVTRLDAWFRGIAVGCTGVAAVLAAMSIGRQPAWAIAATAAAGVAFAVCAVYVGFNQQPRIHGHRACASRLWLVCEQYRGLLAEMQEGVVELAALRDRRQALLQEAAAVFEHAAPADRYTLEIARRALGSRAGAPVAPAPPPVATPPIASAHS